MRIYCIKNNTTKEIIYIGSTSQPLYVRKASHHYSYKSDPRPVHLYMNTAGGLENFVFENISEHPGITRTELLELEKQAIIQYNPPLNTQRNPIQTPEEFVEYQKQYYQKNSKKRCAYQKEWGAQRFVCECGSDIRRGDLARHLRSAKHAIKI